MFIRRITAISMFYQTCFELITSLEKQNRLIRLMLSDLRESYDEGMANKLVDHIDETIFVELY